MKGNSMRLLRIIAICSISLALAGLSRAQTSTPVSADFNGDGQPDIVWRDYQSGMNVVWYMNGSQYVSYAQLPAMPDGDLSWRLAIVCDWNNDGSPDIVWRNLRTGKNQIWLMKNTTLLGTIDLPEVPDENWGLAGAGDFNGDGQIDLVWRNWTAGRNVIWLMHGDQIASQVELDAVNTEWEIAAVADFNGDGKPDLLWADIWRGLVSVWTMNGTSVSSRVNVGKIPDPNRRIQSVMVDRTGQALILWRDYYKGFNWIQPIRNLQVGNLVSLPVVPDTNWQMAGPWSIDPTTLLSDTEKTMLEQENATLAAGGYDDIGGMPGAVASALYTMHGERVFTFPHPASTSKMYQAAKQILDNEVNNDRLNREAVEQALGGYNGSDPATGLQAWFGPSGEEFVWGDFRWQ
jgi:hypothetical protein